MNFTAEKNIMGKWLTGFFFLIRREKSVGNLNLSRCFLTLERK